MKFEIISISLLASMLLCSCSKPADDQKTSETSNAPIAGQKHASVEPPAAAVISPQRAAISSSQIISDHFANSDKTSESSQLHDLFLQDERDGSWAYQRESLLKQRLGPLASSTSVEISQVECRSTMCEVLATTGNPATIGTDVDRWQDAVYGSRGQLEQAGLSVQSITFTQNTSGQVVIVTHLIRRKVLAHRDASNNSFKPTPLRGAA